MTQHVTYRLPEETVEELRYLAFLTQTSPARVIATWIHLIVQTVDAKAGTTVPGREDGGELLRNGGTFLTLEEQQALTQLHQVLVQCGRPDPRSPNGIV